MPKTTDDHERALRAAYEAFTTAHRAAAAAVGDQELNSEADRRQRDLATMLGTFLDEGGLTWEEALAVVDGNESLREHLFG